MSAAHSVPGSGKHSRAKSSGWSPHVHGLRGVLAFSLFIFHVTNSGLPDVSTGPVAQVLYFLSRACENGVELFFGISGIVMVGAFRNSPGPLAFMSDRISRLFPVLWTTVLLIAVMSRFSDRHHVDLDLATVLANLFALTPIAPFHLIHPAAWSINFELVFYALIMAYGAMGRYIPRQWALAVSLIAGMALISVLPRAAPFLIGVGVGVLGKQTERDPLVPLYRFAGLSLVGALVCFQLSLAAVRETGASGGAIWTNATAFGWWTLAIPLTWVTLRGLMLGSGWFASLLTTTPVQWLGTISYSLYLWQAIAMAPVKMLMNKLGWTDALGAASQPAFFLLALGPTLVASAVSQKLLEIRATRWMRNLLGGSGRQHLSQAR